MRSSNTRSAIVTLAVIVFVATTAWYRGREGGDARGGAAVAGIPRLLDLGSDICVPCKEMAPILEELRKEYAGRAVVDIVDVWKVDGAMEEYGVLVIPTQIFFDREGREVWRHEGFLSKEAIVAKFREIGVR